MRSKDRQRFVQNFRFINALDMKWPIQLSLDGGDLRVGDDHYSLLIARQERLYLYTRGIAHRFEQLGRDYLLAQVPMSHEDLMVDVGANIGEVGLLVALRHGCRVLAIEPEVDEFRCLQRNVANIAATCVNSPLWSEEAEVPFYSKNATGDSSVFEISGYTGMRMVRATTLKAVLDHAGASRVRLLKLEAEGAEPEVLQGAGDWLQRIDYVTADVGPERGMSKESTAVPVIARMKAAGFELIGVSGPRLVCLFRNRQLAVG